MSCPSIKKLRLCYLAGLVQIEQKTLSPGHFFQLRVNPNVISSYLVEHVGIIALLDFVIEAVIAQQCEQILKDMSLKMNATIAISLAIMSLMVISAIVVATSPAALFNHGPPAMSALE